MNDLRILLTADLNRGLSIGEINKAIKQIQKSSSLNSIKIKIDIDQKIISSLKELSSNIGKTSSIMNNFASANKAMSSASSNSIAGINNETKAVKDRNKALEENLKILKQQVTTSNNGSVKTTTVTGSNYNKTTTSQTLNSDRTIINHPSTQTTNYDAIRKDEEKLANQIADGRIKAQERFQKLQEKTQQKRIDDAHKEAKEQNDLANQMADHRLQSEARVRKEASKWNQDQQKSIQKNAEVQRKEESKNLDSRKEYEGWWAKSLAERQQKEQSFYKSQLDRINNNKSNASLMTNSDQASRITREYDKITKRINEMQSAGRALTQADMDGISKRIKSVDNYKKAQEKLNSVINTSEKSAQSFRSKFGNDAYQKSGIDALLTQLKGISSASKNAVAQASNVRNRIAEIGRAADESAKKAINFNDALATAFKKVPVWMIAMTAIYGPLRALQNGITIVADLDAAMTNLKKVTDETDATYKRFSDTAHNIGNDIANTSSNVIRSATEWARLGYSIEQAQTLAKQTLVYQNVGDLKSAEEASLSLISAIKGFGVEVDVQGKNITKIVDIYNEVGNKYAISSAGIGEAMRRSASSLAEAGNSIEESVALATAANTTIQDPARVGQMLKTVSMRIRGVSDEGENLTNLLPSMEKKFNAIGLTLKKDETTFKNTYEIFQDLAGVWKNLTDMQRADLLESVAGKLQGNLAASLINNFAEAQGALEAGLNSTGSAAKENATYIDSIAGRVQLFKNAVEEFWAGSLNTEGIKTLIDIGTQLVNSMGSLSKVLTVVISLFAALKAKAIVNASTALITYIATVKSSVIAMGTASGSIRGLMSSLFGLTSAANGTRAAFTAMNVAMGLGVGLAITALTSLYSVYQKTKAEQEEFKQKQEQITSNYADQGKRINDLVNRYKELNNVTNGGDSFSNIEQEQNYKEIVSELSELMPNLIKKIDEKGNAHLKNADEIDKEIERTEKLLKIQNQATVDGMTESYKKNLVEIEKYRKKEEAIISKIQQAQLGLTEFNTETGKFDGAGKALNDYQQKLIYAEKDTSVAFGALRDNIVATAQTILTSLDGIEIDKDISDQIQSLASDLNLEGLDEEEIRKKTYAITELIKIVQKNKDSSLGIVDKKDIENLKIFANTLDLTTERVNQLLNPPKTEDNSLNRQVNELNELLSNVSDGMLPFEEAIKLLNEGIGNSEAMQVYSKSMATTKDEINLLNKAQKEMKDNGQLSSKTVQELSEKYEDFISVTGLSTEKIYEFLSASKNRRTQMIEDAIDSTRVELEQAKLRIEKMKEERNAVIDLLNAKQSLSVETLRAEQLSMRENTKETSAETDELTKRLNILIATLNDFRNNEEKTNKETKKTIEILTQLQKSLKAVKSAIDDLQSNRERMRKGSQEYRNSLAKENELLEKQAKLLKEGISNPSKLISTKKEVTTSTNTDVGSSGFSLSSGSSNGQINNMISSAQQLQSVFVNGTYKQISGEFKGTYDQFIDRALSDCSQFVQEMYKEFLNVKLPRTAAEQAKQGTSVSKSDLQAGDLVFFNTTGKDNSHVGIYTGNSKFIQMGNSGLKEQDLNSSYWAPKFQGARRIVDGESSSGTKNSGKVGSATTTSINAPTSQELSDAKDSAQKEYNDVLNSLFQNNLKILESYQKKYEDLIKDEERIIYASERKQNTLDPNSEAWRHENNVQINAQTRIQDLQRNSKSVLENEMKKLNIASDEFDDYLKQLSSDWLDIQADKGSKVIENLNSQIDSAKSKIEEYGQSIENSSQRMSHLEQGTSDYNKELMFQIDTAERQKASNDELIAFYEKLLTNTKLTAAATAEYRQELAELKSQDYAGTIMDLNASLVESQKVAMNNVVESLNHELEISQIKMQALEEGTKSYNDEAKNQIVIHKRLIEANKSQIKFTEEQLKNEKLSAATKAELRKELNALIIANYQYAQSIRTIRENYADRVIEDYKKMLEKQRDLEMDAFDRRIAEEDERHQKVMDNYDDELKKFEDYINARLKMLDRLNATEDYESEIQKLLKEREEIQKVYNTILNNDSFKDKARRKELLEQLADIDEQIAEKQRDRGRELERNALNDQLEDRRNFLEDQTDAETKAYNERKKALEQEKKMRENYWNSLIDDERYFYTLKQQLMSDDASVVESTLSKLRGQYESFFSYLKSQSSVLGDMYDVINSSFQRAYENLNSAPSLGIPEIKNPITGDTGGTGSDTKKNGIRDDAWKEYLNNKKKSEEMSDKIRMGVSKAQEAELRKRMAELKSINDKYRAQYSFPDGSYEKLKDLQTYHTGGEVGVEGTTTKKWWDKMLKSNEVPAILKNDEVVLDSPLEFIKNIGRNAMNNLASMLSPKQNSSSSGNVGGTVIENINVTLTGMIKDGADFADKMVGSMQRKGIRVNALR